MTALIFDNIAIVVFLVGLTMTGMSVENLGHRIIVAFLLVYTLGVYVFERELIYALIHAIRHSSVLDIATWVGSWLLIGVCWAFVKWWRRLRRIQRIVDEVTKNYVDANLSNRNRSGKLDFEFKNEIYRKAGVQFDLEDPKTLVTAMWVTIISWVVFWPATMLAALVTNPFRMVSSLIRLLFETTFVAMAETILGSIRTVDTGTKR